MKKIFSRKAPDFVLGSASGFVSSAVGAGSSSSVGLSVGGGGLSSGSALSASGSVSVMMSTPGPWTVGRHNVVFEEVIAEGGFGVVFLVRQKDNGRRLALKRLFVNNDRDLAVAKREISILSNLNGHRNLIGYVDSSITMLDGDVHEVLILMPYHKVTLLQMMNDRLQSGFSESEVMSIFCDICEGVSRLHHCQTPILHRDLKVENVLQTLDGSYVLCDFGSATAKVLDPKVQGITQIEEEIKRYTTLSYRAPEMVDLYQGKPLTSKTDIWALGCMLYKICFFTLPFGESPLAIQAGQVTFPATSKYSANLHKLIKYILTVEPDLRPDIYQVAHLACGIAGRECKVPNMNSAVTPSLESLDGILLRASEVQSAHKEAASTPAKDVVFQRANCIEPTNTSVAPRQRPRGAQSSKLAFNGAAISIPLLPTVPSSPSMSSSSSIASTTAAASTASVPPAKPIVTNPFATDTFPVDRVHSNNPFVNASDEALDQPERSSSNPFLPESHVSLEKWNPFEDSKKFGELSEEALFGEQFDQIRMQQSSSATESGTAKRDPFVAAPFPVVSKNS